MLGMSLWSSPQFSPETLRFLRSLSFLSCRNRRDVRRLEKMGVKAHFAHDNAFALDVEVVRGKPQTLGVNVVPRHMKYDGSRYVPIGSDKEKKFGPSYSNLVRAIASRYLDNGWTLVHIPFTPHDARYAKQVFAGLDVTHRGYTPGVRRTYQATAACSRVVATRYHAHIFALKSRTPVYSLSYAPKCRLLWQDLQLPSKHQITQEETIEGDSESMAQSLLSADGLVLSEDKLSRVEEKARNSISESASNLLA